MRSGNRRLNSGVPPRQPGRSRHRPGSTSVSSFRASSTRSKETKATFSNTEVGGRADLVRAGHMLARREYMHQTGRTSCTSGHLPCLASHRISALLSTMYLGVKTKHLPSSTHVLTREALPTRPGRARRNHPYDSYNWVSYFPRLPSCGCRGWYAMILASCLPFQPRVQPSR